MKIDHIGIVVKDIASSIQAISFLMAQHLDNVSYEVIDSQRLKIALIKLENVCIELLQPIDKSSTIYHFLEQGGGLHHLCYMVDSIDKYLEKNRRYIKVIRKKEIGLEGRYTAFFFIRKSFQLIELIEPSALRRNEEL